MERYSDLQFRVFDWLRFPLIVGVVFIHCFGKPFEYEAINFAHLTGMDYFNLFRVSISHVLTHVCVPTFYLISGYLFFIGMEEWNWNVYLNKLKKRARTLLFPFLIWNTICILLTLFSVIRHEGLIGIQSFFEDNGYWRLYWDCKQWNLDRTNWFGGANSASSPYLVPLWFLRDLMIVCICSPMLYYLFRITKVWGLLLLVICYITGVFIPLSGFSIMAFMFFGLGGYYRINIIDTTKVTYNLRYYIYIVAAILWIVCTMFNGHNTKTGNMIYPFYVIVGCMAIINIATHFVKNNKVKMPAILSNSSFFIYLLHCNIVIGVATTIVWSLFDKTNVVLLLLGYLLIPIITVFMCFAIYYLLNKYTPFLCKILVGNR